MRWKSSREKWTLRLKSTKVSWYLIPFCSLAGRCLQVSVWLSLWIFISSYLNTVCEMNAYNFYFLNFAHQHSSSGISVGALDTGDFPWCERNIKDCRLVFISFLFPPSSFLMPTSLDNSCVIALHLQHVPQSAFHVKECLKLQREIPFP